MANYYKKVSGCCPYCSCTSYGLEEVRKEGQTLMQCSDCNEWSVRVDASGAQYPLQDPSDKTSPPGFVSIV